MLTRKQQAQLLTKALRFQALKAQHLRLEKEYHIVREDLLHDLGTLTRLELPMETGGLVTITVIVQDRQGIDQKLLLLDHPAIYDEVLITRHALLLHIEFSGDEASPMSPED